MAVETGGGGGPGGASIALLAGLNSSLCSFSCSHYKDSQRKRVDERVTKGEGKKSHRQKSRVRRISRPESGPGPESSPLGLWVLRLAFDWQLGLAPAVCYGVPPHLESNERRE